MMNYFVNGLSVFSFMLHVSIYTRQVNGIVLFLLYVGIRLYSKVHAMACFKALHCIFNLIFCYLNVARQVNCNSLSSSEW